MAKGIQIGVAADTKAFKQGVELGIIKPLDDAQEALDDLGKSKGLDQLERGLDDAQDATERLQKETKDTARTIDQEYRDSYRSMKRSSDTGIDGAKEGMRDFKREANSTAKESAASFDGSAESVVDSFQEIAANAFEGFGPAGAAAGVAAAVGIGLVGAAFQQSAKDAEKMADLTVDAYDRMEEAGGNFYNQETELAALRRVVNDPEQYKEVLKIMELIGLSEEDSIRAVALNGKEREGVIDLLKEQAELNRENIRGGIGASVALKAQNVPITDQIKLLEQRNEADALGARQFEAIDRATGGLLTKRAEENELIQKRNRALSEAPKQTVVKVAGDTKQLEADIARATTKKSLTLVINAIDRAGKKIN